MFFKRLILIANKDLLRHWTLKRSQVIFDEKKFGYELVFFHFDFVYCLPVSLKKPIS